LTTGSDLWDAPEDQRHVGQGRHAGLLTSQAVFQSLFESAPDAIVIVDADGRIVLANRQVTALFGYDAEELLGEEIAILLPERFRAGHEEHRAAYTARPRTRPMGSGLDLYGRRKDGSEFPVEISLSPTASDDGLLITSIIRDVSRRKQTEERLRQASADLEEGRARLRAILDSAPHGIIYFDAADGHVSANPQAARLLGRPVDPRGGIEQLLGVTCWTDGQPVALEDLLASRALRGEAVVDVELVLVRPDGTRVPLLCGASPVRDGDGRLRGAVVIVQDISRIKELERLREEWTSAVAHDLRQPVAAITAYANLLELLTEDATAGPQERSAIAHILAGSRQLYRMIGDVMDVSRLGAGQLRLDRTRVHLERLVPDIVDRARDLLGGHAVAFQFDEGLPEIDVDPARLEQVLVNLLSNAGKYAAADTEVTLRVDRAGGMIEIGVCNQGQSISAEELPHLFDRFFRSRSAQSSRIPGLGLGLYICKELVEAHGGRIWAESADDHTTIRFSLPLSSPPQFAGAPSGV
jgi:PAS domain S-box-containing protein